MVIAVRGAIQVRSNDAETIGAAGIRLLKAVIGINGVKRDEIISIVFSLTPDLTRANPATAVRINGYPDTPLFCVQEAMVDGQPERIIRLLLTYRAGGDRTPVPIYLDGAELLRPDLVSSSSS